MKQYVVKKIKETGSFGGRFSRVHHGGVLLVATIAALSEIVVSKLMNHCCSQNLGLFYKSLVGFFIKTCIFRAETQRLRRIYDKWVLDKQGTVADFSKKAHFEFAC